MTSWLLTTFLLWVATTLPTTLGFALVADVNNKHSLHPRKFFAKHTVDGNSIEGELSPVSNNVLVKVKEAASETAGGLIIPDTAKEKCYEGMVVATGPGRVHPETGIRMIMGVHIGEKVIYGKYDGAELLYDDMTHQLIKDDDVLLAFNDGDEATIENVICLKDNILIELPPKNDKTVAGVIVKVETDENGNDSDKPTVGKVARVGPGRQAANGDLINVPVVAGDSCRFRNFAGSEISLSGREYLIIKGHDIQAKW